MGAFSKESSRGFMSYQELENKGILPFHSWASTRELMVDSKIKENKEF